jgi:hypothetical protein
VIEQKPFRNTSLVTLVEMTVQVAAAACRGATMSSAIGNSETPPSKTRRIRRLRSRGRIGIPGDFGFFMT